MSDLILTTGDQAMFEPTFGPAMVAVQPGVLNGSGPHTANGKPICVLGDEKKVMVPGCTYISGAFSVPGVGMLKIQSVAPNQQTMKSTLKGKPILMKGMKFIAMFQVTAPAQMPPPISTPDPMVMYPGQGSFITTNVKCKAT
jgi:Contractile injection system spike tip protein